MIVKIFNCNSCGGSLPGSINWVDCSYCGTKHHISQGQVIYIPGTDNGKRQPDPRAFSNLTSKQKLMVAVAFMVIPVMIMHLKKSRR